MSHKLGHRWTTYLWINNTLVPKGTFDLRTMAPNGDLTHGSYEPVQGSPTPISGNAVSAAGLTSLTLYHGSDTYEGILVYEAPSQRLMIIAGKKSYGTREQREADFKGLDVRILDQDDPPWIITKP